MHEHGIDHKRYVISACMNMTSCKSLGTHNMVQDILSRWGKHEAKHDILQRKHGVGNPT